MGELLLLIGFFLFPVYLVQLIIAVVTKWPVESYLTGLSASGAALIVGFCLVAVGVEFSPGEIIIAAIIILVAAFRKKLLHYLVVGLERWEILKDRLGIKGLPEIVEVKYLGEVVRDKQGGIKGAMLGGMLEGTLGAIIGAVIPIGTETLCRFAVQYDNGELKIQDCRKGSELYKKFMNYVNWDEL